jgi:hypothetical protein
MKIVKQSTSLTQQIQFTTIKDLEDYIVVTIPLGFSIEVAGNFIHVRENKK